MSRAERILEVRDREDDGCPHPLVETDANGDRWCAYCHRPFDMREVY